MTFVVFRLFCSLWGFRDVPLMCFRMTYVCGSMPMTGGSPIFASNGSCGRGRYGTERRHTYM